MCKDKNEEGNSLEGTIHAVSFNDAMVMTQKWQEKTDSSGKKYTKSYTFSKEDFIEILNEEVVRYVRIYPCVEDDGSINLLAVGADCHNVDIINEGSEASGIYNFATPCPDTCGESPLNHDLEE
ncbi:MAG: hypothetical protein AB8B56_11580 [Crocinitomicaceae bacterium]